MCFDVKCVIHASIGDVLVLDNYVNTDISIVRVLRRVPKDSRVPLADSRLDKMNVLFYSEKILLFGWFF